MPTVDDVADRLFAAIERGDVAAVGRMWRDDVRLWHSGDHRDRDHARGMNVIDWLIEHTVERRYVKIDRQVFDGGFVQQHVLHATGTGGGSISMRVCIVVGVDTDGLITRVDEYFDPADLRPLLDELWR
jgi:ketosteroid isomerase-like protein